MIKGIIKHNVVAMIIATALCLSACSGEQNTPVNTGADKSSNTVSEQHSGTVLNDEEDLPEPEQEDPVNELNEKHVRLRLDGDGKDLFALWGGGRPDYRYGPAIIVNPDGGIDAWFASPGDSRKEYDWITYRHSDDGGNTWSEEKVVLSPTPESPDKKSVCDPDVVYYDGYYYMAYTGTVNEDGLCNNVFIARSENPDGPYRKWGADGWDSSPVPVVYYYGVDNGWGVGEPSLVIKDDTLYMYSTLDSFVDGGWVRATRVHMGDLKDPMWPSKLQMNGICAYRQDHTDSEGYEYADSDSWDVAYLKDSDKFIALSTNRRFKDDSCLLYYESDDGITFHRVSEINTGVICGCHNCGLSTDRSGQLSAEGNMYLGYAYSGKDKTAWGVWATRFVPITIDYTDNIDRTEDGRENLKQKIVIDESLLSKEPIMLLTDQLSYMAAIDNPVSIQYYVMSSYRGKSRINSKDVTIEKYDRDMFKISENNQLVPLKEGSSMVGVEYNGLRREINIRVLPSQYDDTKIKRFYPVCSRYDIRVDDIIAVKIRPMAVMGDYELEELSKRDLKIQNIEFRSSDESVCTVDEEGMIETISPGTAVITIQGEDCKYTLDVYVSE